MEEPLFEPLSEGARARLEQKSFLWQEHRHQIVGPPMLSKMKDPLDTNQYGNEQTQ